MKSLESIMGALSCPARDADQTPAEAVLAVVVHDMIERPDELFTASVMSRLGALQAEAQEVGRELAARTCFLRARIAHHQGGGAHAVVRAAAMLRLAKLQGQAEAHERASAAIQGAAKIFAECLACEAPADEPAESVSPSVTA